MNLKDTIIPKSDQLNADDLIAGPMTITITAVESGNREQPVVIRYHGDNGHPYKPGKSMRRVFVAMWGGDGKTYVGKRITLYRDPLIKFGSDQVGGIRISHASGIVAPFEIALTVTRGKRKMFRVEPLADAPDASSTPAQSVSAGVPENYDELAWGWVQVGEERAAGGIDALQAWFKSLPEGADKKKFWGEHGAKLKAIAEGK